MATKQVKILLRSADTIESIWCDPIDAKRGLYRLDSIPFFRARPTYRDVIHASADREGSLTFRKLHERGGFVAAQLEYSKKSTFAPLAKRLRETHGAAAEAITAPSRRATGFLVMAVKDAPLKRVLAEIRAEFPDATSAGEERPRVERKERAPDADDALHAAVTKGEVRALKAALLAGARLESRRGGQARTALLAAVALRELAVVKVLVAAGAKLGAKDERGEDSVFLAAARGDVKLLDLLHRAGAKLRARTSSGQTPLHIAVLSGHLPLVRRLLALGAAKDLRLLDEALVCAVNRERPEIARLLLKAGARVDVEDEGTGLTPLEAAAYRGSLRTAKVLLEAGGAQDLDAALREAAAEGDARMARLLLAAGANPLHRSAKGNTALALARKRRHLAVVALLSKPRS